MKMFSKTHSGGDDHSHMMHRFHMPRIHAHTTHMHPMLWAQKHPLITALLLAAILALLMVAMTDMVDTGIYPEVLDARLPAVYPTTPAY